MKKSTILATLTLATAVLAIASQTVSADETGVVTSPVDVVVTKPDEKPVQPVQPTQPAEPTKPSETEEPTKPVEPTSPVDPSVDKKEDEKPVEPVKPSDKDESKEEDKKDDKGEDKKDDKKDEKPSVPVNPNVPTAPNVPADDLVNKPIITNQGHKIVGTNNGNVLVEEAGVVVEKTAQEVGAVKQKDGTVALKDDKGELKVLPSTGTKESILASVLGVVTLVAGAVFKKKMDA